MKANETHSTMVLMPLSLGVRQTPVVCRKRTIVAQATAPALAAAD